MNRRNLGALAFVVMIVADVVLVAWALGLIGGASPDQPRPTRSSTQSATSAPVTDSGQVDVEVPARLLATVGTDHAWRAESGACEGARPSLERTADGGRSWKALEVPGQRVLRIRFTSQSQGFLVVADDACRPAVVLTGDGGKTWGGAGPATATWALAPKGGGLVVPGGKESTACAKGEAQALVVTADTEAWVLCEGGVIRASDDAGASWDDRGEDAAAVHLGASSDDVVVLSKDEECDGLQVRTGPADDELELTDAGCLETERSSGAVAVVDGGGWAADGETTWRSPDLKAWTAVEAG